MNVTAPRPTENAAIGACPRDPKPRRHLLDLALLRMIALRNGDQRGVQLFTAMIRRLAGIEVAW